MRLSSTNFNDWANGTASFGTCLFRSAAVSHATEFRPSPTVTTTYNLGGNISEQKGTTLLALQFVA